MLLVLNIIITICHFLFHFWLNIIGLNLLQQLADEGPPAPQDVATKKSKKIAFADEAGGRLCQVKFYENEEGSSLESDRKELLP